jgi:hypothetical protein
MWLEALMSMYQMLGVISTEVQQIRKAHSLSNYAWNSASSVVDVVPPGLLPVGTMSNIVAHPLTRKALHFARIPLLPTATLSL